MKCQVDSLKRLINFFKVCEILFAYFEKHTNILVRSTNAFKSKISKVIRENTFCFYLPNGSGVFYEI